MIWVIIFVGLFIVAIWYDRARDRELNEKAIKYTGLAGFFYICPSMFVCQCIAFETTDLFAFIFKKLLLPSCLVSILIVIIYNRMKGNKSFRCYIIMLFLTPVFVFGSAGYVLIINNMFAHKQDCRIFQGQVIQKYFHVSEDLSTIYYVTISCRTLSKEIKFPVSPDTYRQIAKGEIYSAKIITGLFGIVYYELDTDQRQTGKR